MSTEQEPPEQDEPPILSETQGRVALIRLNRPRQMNALSDALMDALGAALLGFDARDDIGVIVITGNDKAFADGADIAQMQGAGLMDMLNSQFITRNWETIRQVRKPVIAAVAGLALGGGLVLAAQGARFGLPEIKLALLPGAGGTQRLPRAIGKAKTMDMCLSARTLSADEADRYGLVSRVLPDDQLLPEALALAQTIAAYSAPALMAIKESVNRAFEGPLSEGILFERRALYARFASADAQEGMAAFLARRAPVFSHR